MSDEELPSKDREALLRWRLALGTEAERTSGRFALSGLEGEAGSVGLDPGRLGDLDRALSFVYDDKHDKSGGLAASRPYIPKWLAAVRELFSHEVVALVQKDAIERRGLKQLLFEPETLPLLEKNVELVATLMSARGLIPDRAREAARQIVQEVVDDIRKTLETELRTAVLGALRQHTTSPLRVARNLDWKRTIQKNLKGWDASRKRLVPERLYFWANQQRRHEWDVAVLVDQSGSMAESVVYSSIMAAIFASIDVLRTRLLFFDTEVVDVTPLLVDPVEALFTAQLGGGTDINRAVAYAQQHFIERPEKTLFILISDLYEGGNKTDLLGRLQQLVDSRVKTVCLLALTDGGKPSYDHEMAAKVTALGIPCFGCTPKLLVKVVERIMKGQDLGPLVTQEAR
ncbi:VWA domain-containing protein [Chondromyces apiculatus]|uniref:Mg-chelatase subunit ChlD n=1 Tax=Chondromyces apiculatus DSM 436 TaxID=1192034 RepID=A0A017TAA6_9BACT|nr:VWA domain-containing protein [Chondromyces apiculatus]EYF06213.1 Mg-chelatase subunit ChlD [Chondromyces apiculatus DSM 436]